MFSKFKPTWMLEAIYQLTPEQLRAHGIEAVLADLDNTLTAWNNPDGTEEMLHWIETMKQAGIPVVVVSNNKASRIDRAVKHLGLEYVSRAMKPFGRGFRKAEKQLNLPPEKMVMVGDQLMTDIRGANGAGIRSILVKPLVETDGWNTRINRAMERVVMSHLLANHADMKWRSDIHE
ncbi:YqeG family HAD IIIA-type phosphatase [Vagococcus acidifermentans]|uniref:HAD family hydrolase n=1 Tax=Vagococcus acidifermentans TaxID=564710 RepID=A0A430APV0_9ENTE|nr:YqeG family HAD IIIA-type phosphatase [Vagococcus acidifermentans]RSU10095.1 HAD family hydrolase [Vagococcus acidifermentans]